MTIKLPSYIPFRTFLRWYNTFPKTPIGKALLIKNTLSYEEYKQEHIENLETFKKSPTIQLVAKGNVKKIEYAYERFCRSQYAEYKQQQIGGNPMEMI